MMLVLKFLRGLGWQCNVMMACTVDLRTRLGDGCVQCSCVELVMVHHTFHGSDLLKLPPECNKWNAYIWSLIGVQLTWLVVTRKCWCFATQNGLLQLCVLEQGSFKSVFAAECLSPAQACVCL